MTLPPSAIQKLDNARRRGASQEDILTTLEQLGVPDPKEAVKEYAKTPLPDGRPRWQVNLGDPAEWDG